MARVPKIVVADDLFPMDAVWIAYYRRQKEILVTLIVEGDVIVTTPFSPQEFCDRLGITKEDLE